MADKPRHASEYRSEQVELVRAMCLYVATKLGDMMDDLLIVGGLVPSILKRDFAEPDAVGPMRVAAFVTGGKDEALQADVVGFIGQLLDTVGSAG
jgi:hypothetical protein